MVKTSTRLPSIQHLVEIKTVAEQLNFKISTLLLHGGRIMEAIMWFRRHVASYRKLIGAPEVNFLHWEWLSRQFLVFAELLDTSAATIQAIVSPGFDVDRPTEWEFSSAYYYQLAASYLKEKQSCLELALSMSERDTEIDRSVESVIPSDYVGQFARLIEHGELFEMELLADEDYVYYALAEGKRFLDSFEIIALLKKSFETFSNVNAQRMASYCGFQIAREYFSVSDFNSAKQMFDSIVVLYRREGWVTLLWDVLGYLRECSRRLGSVKDFIEYSLEMAGLPVSSLVTGMQSFKKCGPAGPAYLSQREVIHKEVFGLVRGESAVASSDNNCLNISGDHPLFLEIDLVSPLRIVLLASVAFHEQIVKSGIPTLITLSLLSQLPHTFEIDQLEIQFNQADCNFIIVNGQRPQLAAISHVPPGRRVETAPDLALVTNKWLRLRFDINSEQSGKLECIYVLARIGPNFTICCRAESPASMDDLPLWKFEDRVETFPTKDPGLAFSGQKATQVEEPDPQVDLKIGSFGPALVGERFVVPVIVASKGHSIYSGELKINLVDVRGGGLLSPREVQSFSEDNLHVQLLGISGLDCSDESQNGSDSIRKIQHSFGLVSVPFLNGDGLWSCKLEIRWHRPKPIMLYVSLGYSPHSNEPAAQRGQVHKSLQIEGITAVVVGHQYMLPFRREPLLLSKVKPVPDSNHISSLPLKKTSILIVCAKNCTEIPLQLLSLSVEEEDVGSSCIVQQKGEDLDEPESLVAGEVFKKVFTVTPGENVSKLNMGTVCVRWRRDSRPWEQTGGSTEGSEVWTKHKLSDVSVELPPLVVSLVCPPHAILGNPFTYSIRIHNQTQLLQEVKLSVADSQSFVLSGSHSDTIFVLPKSEHSLDYMLVPLASGKLLLPRVTITSTRYSAAFQPSVDASTVFVFPSDPQFMMIGEGETIKESSAAQS